MECRVVRRRSRQPVYPLAWKNRSNCGSRAGPACAWIRAFIQAGPSRWSMMRCSPKLVTWGPDRNAAIQRLERALAEYSITGIQTNIAFLSRNSGRSGVPRRRYFHRVHSRFSRRGESRRREPPPELDLAVALAALAHFQKWRASARTHSKRGSQPLAQRRTRPAVCDEVAGRGRWPHDRN